MSRFADRHQNAMNATYFDGHAHRVKPTQIWGSVWLSGCVLVHRYPASTSVCDISYPGCTKTDDDNLCNKWALLNPYPDN
jgi:prepilin-type processing-associated H-X9-DG protein